MKKALLIVFIAICIMLSFPLCAFAIDTRTIIDSIDITSLQRSIDSAGAGVNISGVIESLSSGQAVVNPDEFMNLFVSSLSGALTGAVPVLIKMLVPALLCCVASQLKNLLTDSSIAENCVLVCFLVAATGLIHNFLYMLNYAKTTIVQLADWIKAIMPVLMTMFAMLGGKAAAGVLQPMGIASAGMVVSIYSEVVMKLCIISAAVAVLGNISTRFKLSQYMKLLQGTCNVLLGVGLTVYLGVMSVQGVLAAAFDGVSIRTAKYAIDNIVPIVGGELADTVDTLVASALVVKNALGVAGMLVIVGICATPLMQLGISIFAYRLCAAIIEPLGEERIAGCLEDFSKVARTLFVAVLSASALFFLFLGALLVAANVLVMMR